MKRNEQNIRHRPRQCPHCGSRAIHAHGTTPKARRVKLLRFRCWNCGRTHNVHPDPVLRQLSTLGIKQSFGNLLRDFGLLALGLPVNQIKNLTGRKAETIHRTLARCRNEPDLWDAICFSMRADHNFSDSDLDRLEKISNGEKDDASPFQIAFGKRTDSAGFFLRVLKRRDVLCARIEGLIGGQVAYTSTGEFWRADVDVEQNPWIKQIRAASDGQLDEFWLDTLYPIAFQVMNPNAKAQTLAVEQSTPPLMTICCLCAGMEPAMGLPEFMDGLKEIIKQLK